MKLNLNQVLLGLDGKELKMGEDNMTVGKMLAGVVSNSKSTEFDHFKKFSLATKFYNESESDLDKSDNDKLLKIIEQDQNFGSIILGQLIGILKK